MPATTLADRAVIRVSGEGVRDFLQGLVTSDMAGPLPVWTGLLTPQGKALFDFIVWADGGDLLLDCEASQSEALVRRLSLYRLRRPIAIARDEALAVHWSPCSPAGNKNFDPRLPELGRRWLAPAGEGSASSAWRANRLSLGVTEGVAELGSDKTLWLEANARELGGVSFAKGCYVGQENTARMHHRAKVNRRLVVRRLVGDPGEGARAHYPELGVEIALMRVEAIRAHAGVVMPGWLREAVLE